jgi:hypothetical protein
VVSRASLLLLAIAAVVLLACSANELAESQQVPVDDPLTSELTTPDAAAPTTGATTTSSEQPEDDSVTADVESTPSPAPVSTCLTDDDDLRRWGDFVVARDPAAVETIVTTESRVAPWSPGDGSPADVPGAQVFRNLAEAETVVPWLEIPRLDPVPTGYRIGAVIVVLHPETEELVEVSTWYARSSTAVFINPRLASADLLVYGSWRRGLPREKDARIPPTAYPGFTTRPLECLVVASRQGVYIGFNFPDDEAQLARGVRNAVQWTTADGGYWTVRGVFPRDELVALAESLATQGLAASAE